MVRRILIVESESDIGNSLAALLGTIPDARTETVGSYAKALRALNEGPWDVVIADQRLPDGEGVGLLRHCLERHPLVKRVLLTGYGDYDAAARAINEAHVHHFVQKPWDPVALHRTIQGLLQPMPPATDTPSRIPPATGTWPRRDVQG